MFYPVMINIEGKRIVVVGGGKVALRKVKTLLEYKACVRVISPQFLAEFKGLRGEVELINECYREEFIKDAFMVVAATNSTEVNLNIESCCKENNILCNITDDMKHSDFITPSSLRRGSLVMAVSTEGKSPALAAKIKRELEERYPERYEAYVDILGEIRELLQSKCGDIKLRKKLLNEALDLSLEELLKRRDELEVCCRF